MNIPIKILSLLVLLNIVYLHGMEVDKQKDVALKDPKLLLALPDEIFTSILDYSLTEKNNLDDAIKHLVALGLTCKKFEHHRTAEKIKTILSPSQEKLDDTLLHCSIGLKKDTGIGRFLDQEIYIGLPALTELLIKLGANVNYQDKYGYSLLHYGVQCGTIDIVEILLKNNANIHLQNNWGSSPVHFATRRDFFDWEKSSKGICRYNEEKFKNSSVHIYRRTDNNKCLELFIMHELKLSLEYSFEGYTDKLTIEEWARKNNLKAYRFITNTPQTHLEAWLEANAYWTLPTILGVIFILQCLSY